MTLIALVEDNSTLRRFIMREFAGSDILTDAFSHIEPAWLAIRDGRYSAIIIDRRLPDGDGLELVRHLRAAGDFTPCLMLSARSSTCDRVAGLHAGADDYLVKPFAMEELLARTQALIRRTSAKASSAMSASIVVAPVRS